MNYWKIAKKYDVRLKVPYLPLGYIIAVVAAGTVGYYYIWRDYDVSIFDAFYMTFITIATIGFGEIYPLDDRGRMFTVVISMLGIGGLTYMLSNFMENLIRVQMFNLKGKKKMLKKIESLENHYIITGYGRVGKTAAKELKGRKKDFVIVSDNLSDELCFELEKEGTLYIKGDATSDEVLMDAGIAKAKGIIVATGNSATSTFVVLSARVLSPGIHIVTRADDPKLNEKLKKAGADQIVNPYSIGGTRMASLLLFPNLIKFFDTSLYADEHSYVIESIIIGENSHWVGKSLAQLNIRKHSGASIIAIIRGDEIITNPGGDFLLTANDNMVLFGKDENIQKVENMMDQP